MFEIQRKLDEKVLKLYSEGAIDVSVSIRLEQTNEDMRKILTLINLGKIEHYKITRTVAHPMKDIGPKVHEKWITVLFVASPFKAEEILKEFEKLAETKITRIQAGLRLFKGWQDGQYIVYKEEEP